MIISHENAHYRNTINSEAFTVKEEIEEAMPIIWLFAGREMKYNVKISVK